jgi:hypothetical protein
MQAVPDPEMRAVFARCGLDVVDATVSTNRSDVCFTVYLATRR